MREYLSARDLFPGGSAITSDYFPTRLQYVWLYPLHGRPECNILLHVEIRATISAACVMYERVLSSSIRCGRGDYSLACLL